MPTQEYNTTILIEEKDRIPYDFETAREGKTKNTALVLDYFYNRFQEILDTNGKITEKDIEKVYNEKSYDIEKSYYMRHYIFDADAYKYYYNPNKPRHHINNRF